MLLKLLLFLMPTDVVVASSATSSGGCSVEVPDHGIVECGKSFDDFYIWNKLSSELVLGLESKKTLTANVLKLFWYH